MLVNDYFRATREFVAAQRDIMLAYLGSDRAPRAATAGRSDAGRVAPARRADAGDQPLAPGTGRGARAAARWR